MPETLLIVGASVRAAAQAALRAGFQVSAVDLFGDVDLQAIAPTWQVSPADYPEGLVAAASQAPAGPWMYTGGLENYPRVVRDIGEGRELLGVIAVELGAVRGPQVLRHLCLESGLPVTTLKPQAVPASGTWLRKCHSSSGGSQIELIHEPTYPPLDLGQFYSRFVEGVPQSAVYAFADGGFRLLGVTEQLCGAPWIDVFPFAYAGSIGPLELASDVYQQYIELGASFTTHDFYRGLRGLIGVDTILGHDGLIYPLEVNPRYTASIEILERALPIQPIAWHVAACRHNQLPAYHWEPDGSCAADGKVIVYAKRTATISKAFLAWCLAQNEQSGAWPALADLPHAGTRIESGHPILTAFASGNCVESVRHKLQQQANTVYRMVQERQDH